MKRWAMIGIWMLYGCAPTLPITPKPGKVEKTWHTEGNPLLADLTESVETCYSEVERARARAEKQQGLVNKYNTAAAVVTALGATGTTASFLEFAGDNDNTNKVVGITSALVATAGTIVFTSLSSGTDPVGERAQYERMAFAYERARERRRLVMICQDYVADNPDAVLPFAELPKDASAQDAADWGKRQTEYAAKVKHFKSLCAPLGEPIQVPPEQAQAKVSAALGAPKTTKPTFTPEELHSLARLIVEPSRQYNEIIRYLSTNCHVFPKVFAPLAPFDFK